MASPTLLWVSHLAALGTETGSSKTGTPLAWATVHTYSSAGAPRLVSITTIAAWETHNSLAIRDFVVPRCVMA